MEQLRLFGRHVILPLGRHYGASVQVQTNGTLLELVALVTIQQPGQQGADFGAVNRQLEKCVTRRNVGGGLPAHADQPGRRQTMAQGVAERHTAICDHRSR